MNQPTNQLPHTWTCPLANVSTIDIHSRCLKSCCHPTTMVGELWEQCNRTQDVFVSSDFFCYLMVFSQSSETFTSHLRKYYSQIPHLGQTREITLRYITTIHILSSTELDFLISYIVYFMTYKDSYFTFSGTLNVIFLFPCRIISSLYIKYILDRNYLPHTWSFYWTWSKSKWLAFCCVKETV